MLFVFIVFVLISTYLGLLSLRTLFKTKKKRTILLLFVSFQYQKKSNRVKLLHLQYP